MSFIIWDTESSTVIPSSPFPSKESAEKHIERLVSNYPDVDTGERFAVIEVPS